MAGDNPSILIVGGGTFGTSAAYHFMKRGYTDVTVLDRYAPPALESAGNDVSKVIRTDYSDPMYTRLALEAMEDWSGPLWNDIYHRAGMLSAACYNPQRLKFLETAKAVSESCGIKGLEDMPSPKSIRAKYPVLSGEMTDWRGYLNPSAGWVEADEAMLRLADKAQSLGARYITGEAGWMQKLIVSNAKCTGVVAKNGSKYYADRIVMTTGAWTEGLLDLDAQLEAKGSMVVHYQVSPEETQKYRSIPIVNHLEKGLMFPPTENGLLKFTLGKTLTNIVVSPHTGKETSWPVLGMKQGPLPHHLIQEHFAFRDEVLPELKKRELSYTGVCWCTDSRDQHFLVCRHPRIDNVSVACGGSSHGFKFLPNIGKYQTLESTS